MKSDDLKKLIHNLYDEDRLPAFLIIENDIDSEEAEKKLLNLIIPTNEKDITTHLDCLFITPDEGTYRLEDGNLLALSKFVITKPVHLTRKWVIITRSELLSATISNKLLKILEEPPHYLHFIFLLQKGHHLLPTIRSRAVIFRLSSLQHGKEKLNSRLLSEDATAQFSKIKEFDLETEKAYINALCQNIHSYNGAKNLLETWKKNEFGRLFNQTQAHRFFGLNALKNQK